ncbi:hypothetical protein M513_05737, partial [Trichuris suis]
EVFIVDSWSYIHCDCSTLFYATQQMAVAASGHLRYHDQQSKTEVEFLLLRTCFYLVQQLLVRPQACSDTSHDDLAAFSLQSSSSSQCNRRSV